MKPKKSAKYAPNPGELAHWRELLPHLQRFQEYTGRSTDRKGALRLLRQINKFMEKRDT